MPLSSFLHPLHPSYMRQDIQELLHQTSEMFLYFLSIAELYFILVVSCPKPGYSERVEQKWKI